MVRRNVIYVPAPLLGFVLQPFINGHVKAPLPLTSVFRGSNVIWVEKRETIGLLLIGTLTANTPQTYPAFYSHFNGRYFANLSQTVTQYKDGARQYCIKNEYFG